MPEQLSPERSVVVDRRVDTTLAARDAAAIMRGERASKVVEEADLAADDPSAMDPTKDPAWAAYQQALSANQIPPQRTASDVEKFIVEQVGGHEIADALKNLNKPPEAAKPATAPQQPAKEAAPAQAAQPNTDTPEALQARTSALAALKRDGWTEAAIKKLADDELLQIGTARFKSQTDVDSSIADLRTRLGQAGNKPKPDAANEVDATRVSGGPEQTASPTFDVSVKAAAEALGKQFTEQFGEDIGKPVGTAMEAALRQISQPLLAQNQQLSQGLEAVAGYLVESAARDIKREWRTEYPAALAGDTWAKIQDTQEKLAKTGSYQGLEGIFESFEHARRIVLPGAQPVSVSARDAQEQQLNDIKAAARPIVGGRTPGVTTKSADMELYEKYLQANKLSASVQASLTGVTQ